MAVVATLGLLWLCLDAVTTLRSFFPGSELDEQENQRRHPGGGPRRSLEARLASMLSEVVALPWGALAFTGLISTALVLYLVRVPSYRGAGCFLYVCMYVCFTFEDILIRDVVDFF